MGDSMTDPWDDLLHVVGRGWPHYKEIAEPLIAGLFVAEPSVAEVLVSEPPIERLSVAEPSIAELPIGEPPVAGPPTAEPPIEGPATEDLSTKKERQYCRTTFMDKETRRFLICILAGLVAARRRAAAQSRCTTPF